MNSAPLVQQILFLREALPPAKSARDVRVVTLRLENAINASQGMVPMNPLALPASQAISPQEAPNYAHNVTPSVKTAAKFLETVWCVWLGISQMALGAVSALLAPFPMELLFAAAVAAIAKFVILKRINALLADRAISPSVMAQNACNVLPNNTQMELFACHVRLRALVAAHLLVIVASAWAGFNR